jgi:1-acyl-sn-glycerol-3-phosphate acyltransferase
LLNVFPEGSRSEDGRLQPVQGGVALAIRRAKVPVVPVGIAGAYEAWPRHRTLPRPGKVRIVYGPPRELHHLANAEIVAELEKLLVEYRDKAEAWRAEDL